jgi:hypothetical protein
LDAIAPLPSKTVPVVVYVLPSIVPVVFVDLSIPLPSVQPPIFPELAETLPAIVTLPPTTSKFAVFISNALPPPSTLNLM